MDETKKTGVQLSRDIQAPVKTEWNSRCVLFTYFQGDINSVVDEHFSRALRNIKRPCGPYPTSQSENVILSNDGDMPPNQWRFSSPWSKPRPETSLVNGASSSSFTVPVPVMMDQYPLALPEACSVPTEGLWHFPTLASSHLPQLGYPQAFSNRHLVLEPQPDRRHDPLLSLIQVERSLKRRQEYAQGEEGSTSQIAGSSGLLLSGPSSPIPCKKVCGSPSGESARPSSPDQKRGMQRLKKKTKKQRATVPQERELETDFALLQNMQIVLIIDTVLYKLQ
ncbi:transcription cofactor vestigial-like protein 1 [Perognathus longimembris pacificus]|uniref:transcription cofactor vestigial-like protein 1 n=1 Tax=Perognathus longimembris pacificus TaxID=214514 RepID=UPI0020198F66|nr:transcription cofactor vestigial-like protein 1 [Perognathus longimembris pacificus]